MTERGGRGDRPDWRAARNTARHLVEGWALEATEQRKLATEYREHVTWLAGELRALQRAAGIKEHACATCERAASPGDSEIARPDGGH